MAEISYPFAAANEFGGTEMVSQVQWQAMANMWGGDRVDFTLASESYASETLPFSATVINGRTVEIQPGRAWVGGFYYQLTSSATVNIESNPTERDRKDTIVLRADVTKGSVNLAVVKGQPSASPVAPQPQRSPGGTWEMVLYEVTAPKYDGAIVLSLRAPFKMPPAVTVPWNMRPAAEFMERGTFLYDMDNNGGDTQHEAWVGRDGYVVTRHFGKSRPYTPSLVRASNVPSSGFIRTGRWRWIAPNTVFFSVSLENTTTKAITNTGGSTSLGFTLPQAANANTGQVIQGWLHNPNYNSDLPNLASIVAFVWKGNATTSTSMHIASRAGLDEGYDTLRVLPAKSTLTFSGVYEADVFSE
ncbi:hypothetical protein [Streptomyces sp. URMC 125]|uniref:hypothetical protein n=1 Tax=Streptomyces sp. URMC 125 TaxID=3423419 RepID=UPI003F1D1BBB